MPVIHIEIKYDSIREREIHKLILVIPFSKDKKTDRL